MSAHKVRRTTSPKDQTLVVEAAALRKCYGARTVVEDLNLGVKRGEVYGLLGPNGAGKSTIMRMLLGLARPSGGVVRVLDAKPGSPESLARVGALIESPAFYPYLSGRDNLRTMARHSRAPGHRVGEALQKVDLPPKSKKKYKHYSLGMKQRLGVAAALLKDPELLVLDEPTNGLDPGGVAALRDLIRRLGRGGRTVLLSSHLLGEVEQVCDRVGVVDGGRMVAEGTVADMKRRAGLVVRAEPLDVASRIAVRLSGVEEVRVAEGALKLTVDPNRAAEINRKLVSAGLDVVELRFAQRSLEDAFFELTGGDPA